MRDFFLFLWDLLIQIYILTSGKPWIRVISMIITFILKKIFDNHQKKNNHSEEDNDPIDDW